MRLPDSKPSPLNPLANGAPLTPQEAVAGVNQLEAQWLDTPPPWLDTAQVSADVVHSFAPGLYVRQVTLPANTFAIGHYQKTTHLNVMLKGRVTMMEPDGSRIERSAPLTYVSGPGRKVGYVHEEMVWLNIYATDETDIETLEATYLDKSEAWKAAHETLFYARTGDIADFAQALRELNVTTEQVRQESENLADQTLFPPGSYKCKVGASRIEGKGLIAMAAIEPGEVIAPARIGGLRTPAGRYTNHAKFPNAVMRPLDNGDIELVACEFIAGCHGGMDGEEITVDYRQARQACEDTNMIEITP